MLGKFKPGWDWVLPLTAHCSVHAVMDLLIFALFGVLGHCWWLAIADFVIHFTMDRIKASPNMLGRFKPLTGEQYKEAAGELERCKYLKKAFDGKMAQNFTVPKDEYDMVVQGIVESEKRLKSNTYFWWSLGLGQMVHHLTHYGIILMMFLL